MVYSVLMGGVLMLGLEGLTPPVKMEMPPVEVIPQTDAPAPAASGLKKTPDTLPGPAQEKAPVLAEPVILPAAARAPDAPQPDLNRPPPSPLALEVIPPPEEPARGVVLSHQGDLLTLIGEDGVVRGLRLPEEGHLVDLSGGGLVEVSDIGDGDWVGYIGNDRTTGRPLVAILDLGKQPSSRYEELAPEIEAGYAQAVQYLRRLKEGK